MNLFLVFPVTTDTASRVEFGLDWIFQLALRQKRGHALFVFDSVHPEYVDRIRATADLAFESHDIVVPASKDTKEKMASAIVRRNNIFMTAAGYCQRCIRVPWLWIDADATPTNPQWLDNIEAQFMAQPRRYSHTFLQDSKDAPRFPLPTGVWHMGTFGDLRASVDAAPEVPFERTAGENIISRSSKSRAFQPLKIQDEADFSKVWPEAQIVVGDTVGAYTESLRAAGVHLPKLTFAELNRVCDALEASNKQANPMANPMTTYCPPKIDLRTKEGRAMKAKLNGEKV